MKKRLRKKLAKKAIEKMRRNICIEYHLPNELLFPKKYMTITGFKLDMLPTYCDRCGKELTEEDINRIIVGEDYVNNLPVYILDKPTHLGYICSKSQEVTKESNIKLIIIDFFLSYLFK